MLKALGTGAILALMPAFIMARAVHWAEKCVWKVAMYEFILFGQGQGEIITISLYRNLVALAAGKTTDILYGTLVINQNGQLSGAVFIYFFLYHHHGHGAGKSSCIYFYHIYILLSDIIFSYSVVIISSEFLSVLIS